MEKTLKKFQYIGWSLVIIVSLGFMMQFYSAGEILKEMTEENLQLVSQNTAKSIEGWLEVKGKVVESSAAYLQLVEEEEPILKLLKQQMKRQEAFFSLLLYTGKPVESAVDTSAY
ncbi:hypothetical protein SAMN05192551_106176 [Tindallia magadiensis]|uniref:Uncharacterized protein n=1 Tax=Tindallia magadiensis TaxID=69895 RepID=A0A1I3FI10_9FIRM|nr:hypothetical protein [Tindallia magadiensis]SFI10826.1 hypothetical protein SAMN05192551_106176 [Tindallia magadiensis]